MRRVDVTAAQAEAADVQSLITFFANAMGETARELRATVFIAFPECEVDGIRLWDDRRVRVFLRALHAGVPHLFYFLDSSADFGAIEGFAWASLNETEFQTACSDAGATTPDHVVEALFEHLTAAAKHATRNGDDWRVVIGPLIESFSPEHRDGIVSAINIAMSA